jgi:hypothetical protein
MSSKIACTSMQGDTLPFKKVRQMLKQSQINPPKKIKLNLKPAVHMQHRSIVRDQECVTPDKICVADENSLNKSYKCTFCEKQFASANSMYRHRKNYCHKRGKCTDNLDITKDDSRTTMVVISDKTSDQTSDKTSDKTSLRVIKLEEKIHKLEKRLEEKVQSDEKDQLLTEALTKIQQIGTQNNSVTINQTVNVYLDQNSLNLYDKKKQLYGARCAMDFLQNTMKNAKPNNKLNWLVDPDILGKSASPLVKSSNGQYIVSVSPTQTQTCDLTQVNKITNNIMANSVFKAINDVITPLSDQFENEDENERSQGDDDYFGPAYETPFGDGIYHHLDHYKNVIPLEKNLNYVSRKTSN